MSPFEREALFIGVKEGLKLSVTVFLIAAYFKSVGLERLTRPLYAAILTVAAASLGVMFLPGSVGIRESAVKLTGYSFGLFYIFSLGTLYHATGTDMLGPFDRVMRKNIILVPLVFFFSLLYYVPDMVGSSLYVADLFYMSSGRIGLFLLSGSGLIASVAVSHLLMRRYGGGISLASLFGLPQMLLFLALMKLLAGGVRGFAELSLIPSVQSGLMKLIHDAVHQILVTVMVPDHPILTTTVWKFIGILFGQSLALWLSLIIFALPLMLFVKKHFAENPHVPPGFEKAASRRLYVKSFRDARFLKSIPVFVFLIVIVVVWFAQQGESITSLYNPDPTPISADGGIVTISLRAPGHDLLDGSLHKFSLSGKGETYRLMVLKKPDGTLAVCLDACEICKPDGYGQAREHVVCLYCKTPIPLATVGKPGGCNPIPVKTLVTEKEIKIEVSEIEKMWRNVNSAKSGEIVKQ